MYKTTRSRVFVVLDTNRLWLWMSIKCFWLTLWSRRFERSAAPNATLLRPRDHPRTDLAEMIRKISRDNRRFNARYTWNRTRYTFFLFESFDRWWINKRNKLRISNKKKSCKVCKKKKKIKHSFSLPLFKIYVLYVIYITYKKKTQSILVLFDAYFDSIELE